MGAPISKAGGDEMWGSCRGKITVNADLTEPTGAGEEWMSEWESKWDEYLPRLP